jgi:hypothetical protein
MFTLLLRGAPGLVMPRAVQVDGVMLQQLVQIFPREALTVAALADGTLGHNLDERVHTPPVLQRRVRMPRISTAAKPFCLSSLRYRTNTGLCGNVRKAGQGTRHRAKRPPVDACCQRMVLRGVCAEKGITGLDEQERFCVHRSVVEGKARAGQYYRGSTGKS